ncbi:MAG: metalloregulator ArsR/SmtB family transcription factor [Devosia sp.]
MSEAPNIAAVGALIGDPARASILNTLLCGSARTAGELAQAAGVTRQTASVHLARLEDGGLLAQEKQGRHRYFRLANTDVAAMVETLAVFSTRPQKALRAPGPRDPAMRQARVCYDHLAGTVAVKLLDGMVDANILHRRDGALFLCEGGGARLEAIGVDVAAAEASRRPLCRPCLDWSERRHHLAGSLGAALLSALLAKSWMRRVEGSRTVTLTPYGKRALADHFGVAL